VPRSLGRSEADARHRRLRVDKRPLPAILDFSADWRVSGDARGAYRPRPVHRTCEFETPKPSFNHRADNACLDTCWDIAIPLNYSPQ
jgi:hypothetical protein